MSYFQIHLKQSLTVAHIAKRANQHPQRINFHKNYWLVNAEEYALQEVEIEHPTVRFRTLFELVAICEALASQGLYNFGTAIDAYFPQACINPQ